MNYELVYFLLQQPQVINTGQTHHVQTTPQLIVTFQI